jgi:hypothetical protein
MHKELTPEEQAAVEEAELQEAMTIDELQEAEYEAFQHGVQAAENEAFQHGWNDPSHNYGPSQAALRPSKAAFDCWLSFYPELKDSSYASRGLLGQIYMHVWKSGASEMLEWLQAEASTGTDPLRNGSYEAITSLD